MNDEIVWHVLTHEHRERSADWYWTLGLGTVLGCVASIYFGNYLLAAILIIGVGSICVLSVRGPREHEVKLDRRGVTLDGTLYHYRSIASFWVEDHELMPPDWPPRLFITTTGLISPRHTIPLDDPTHGAAVRAYLLRYIPEEEHEPHLGEHLAELLGL
jgi:hypothetical protein